VDRISWYLQLQEAADEFKLGIEACNAAGRAVARATDENARRTASRWHAEMYRFLESLKRRLIEVAASVPP
jgi:hypothetical protein